MQGMIGLKGLIYGTSLDQEELTRKAPKIEVNECSLYHSTNKEINQNQKIVLHKVFLFCGINPEHKQTHTLKE
jgi:hypothetical protein